MAKRQKKKKISGHIGLLRRNVGNQRRSVGCLTVARPRCQNGTPWVRHGEGLRRSVVVLRLNLASIHSEQILDFCFRTPRIRTPIV